MQPNNPSHTMITRIAGKEISLFFASPIAYLFLATFAAVTLFAFFWGEAFFARNIADVRPLFEWMPMLLIFLASTLTMRLWSEERRTGTLEHVLTQPLPLWHFVVGKFLGCLVLLAIALIITLPLPLTVSLIGDLDWGPVWAGYLATLLLGSAYLSIGLFISARSDNQIVSLISSAAICGLFYLIGSTTITHFFGNAIGEWLRLFSTGARFEAITRGVIDLADLYYYCSIVIVFLTLNTLVLEKERWANNQTKQALSNKNHTNWRLATFLLLANAVIANFWLEQTDWLRLDATRGNQYSISDATTGYLDQLQEPLLVRGYFSEKTHPLLSPLVPQLRDLIQEYQVAGNGQVRVEFIDPAKNPELEAEANQKYAIQPVPFQVADRYQSSIVSSYFNVLIQYGDEYQVLNFRDLIEVKAGGEAEIDVQLRNPEHDLTRAIKKVLNAYQSGGNLFDTVQGKLVFTAYLSDDSVLPQQLSEFKNTIKTVTDTFKTDAQQRLEVQILDPDLDGGKIGAQISKDFGFQPMATSLFSNERFYFYLTLAKDQQVVQIPLDDMSEASFKRNFEAGVKRFASGFTKTVALVAPQVNPEMARYGMQGPQFTQLEKLLSNELNVKREDLSDGSVTGDADILILAAPKNLSEQELFAVDQFLMQGGTVLASTSPYTANFAGRRLSLQANTSGLESWLQHHGLNVQQQLVMDPQNAAFPIPVTRNVGGFQLQEMRMFDYPYFIDVRGEGLNKTSPISADLPQVTVPWASPIEVVADKQNGRSITELLKSSSGAWLSSDTDVMPKIEENGGSGFNTQGATSTHLVGVISQGRFNSYFAGKDSPLLAKQESSEEKPQSSNDESSSSVSEQSETPKNLVVASVIEKSPESARLILFSSNDLLQDQIIQMMGSAGGSEYLASLQLLNNSVDWALEDSSLLSIRSRGHYNRTLPPMEHDSQLFWEYINYLLAAAALGLIALVQNRRNRSRHQKYLQQLAN